jgi:hypothetical protein
VFYYGIPLTIGENIGCRLRCNVEVTVRTYGIVVKRRTTDVRVQCACEAWTLSMCSLQAACERLLMFYGDGVCAGACRGGSSSSAGSKRMRNRVSCDQVAIVKSWGSGRNERSLPRNDPVLHSHCGIAVIPIHYGCPSGSTTASHSLRCDMNIHYAT